MTEINELPVIAQGDISDDDLLILYDQSAASNNTGQVTRGDFLKDVAREDGDHDFGASEITDLTAQNATISNATIITGLTFDTAAQIEKIYTSIESLSVPTISSQNRATVNMTVAGVQAGDMCLVSFDQAVVHGLIVRAYVSAANTVTVEFCNPYSASFASASITTRVMAVRFT